MLARRYRLDDVPQHVPLGTYQYFTAIGHGLWYARSSALIHGDVFQMSCDSKLHGYMRAADGWSRAAPLGLLA